jgi:ATP-dependent helicase/nuclease subunit A
LPGEPTVDQQSQESGVEMKPTLEQQNVITTENQTLIVEAGAGTGKTWALVGRFIHLLEAHPDWPLESMIAITFTIKAAREMHARVRRAIEARAQSAPSGSYWHEHRRNLDKLQISTIHGLCSRILRENAIAAQIDPKFEVVDEAQADLLKETAVRETVRDMVEERHPSLALLESLTVRDLQTEMLNLLSQRGILGLLFEELPDEEGLLTVWREGLKAMRTGLWQSELAENDLISNALSEIPQVEIIDPTDKLVDTVQLAKHGCEALSKGDLAEALQIWLDINLSSGKKDNWGGKEALSELKAMMKALRETAKTIQKAGGLQDIGEYDRQAAHHLQLWRELWYALNEVYDRLKDEEQVLDFDDLEFLTDKLLEIQPRPERLQRFLEGINHLMVDEFQDTNPIQKQIVTALAPIEDSGKFFAVGDAKQSIYRFRQAQVSIFNRTVEEIGKITREGPLLLSTSFRSHSRLVGALNDLFDQVLKPEFGKKHEDYEAHPGALSAHREGVKAPRPCVEVLLLPDRDLEDENISAEDARMAEGRWIATRIQKLRQDKVQVWDKDAESYRDFEYRDAAVLFRATTDLPLYEIAFKAAGVPYMTSSGRGYFERPEVQDLISLLHALLNPFDDLNLAAALRSPLFSLSDETLYRLRLFDQEGDRAKKPIPYQQALTEPPPNDQMEWVNRASQILEELWAVTGQISVWHLLRKALDRTGYEALLAISDEGGGRQLSNVRKLLAQARDQMNLGLGEFLTQLRDLKKREAREGEALGREPESGAVQLMTIHAAKGLEFPVVFVADLGRGKGGPIGSPYLLHDPQFGLVCKVRDQSGDWVKPVPGGYGWAKWVNESMEIAEDKRLLYVAFTRAADLLILSGKLSRGENWLSNILDAWLITEEGDEEELVFRGDYSLQVFRPKELPEPTTSILTVEEETLDLTSVPALARPYHHEGSMTSLSVSALTEILGKGETPSHIRPVVWDQHHEKASDHVPGFILGNIVHHTLAHGFFDEKSEKDLAEIINNFGKQEGLHGEALTKAVMKTKLMLTNLKAHSVYEEIRDAKQRLLEVPFSWSSPLGEVHGVIDVLYQNQAGVWHLLDWKTDYVKKDNLKDLEEKYKTQISIYYHSVSNILKINPITHLVFLNPKTYVIDINPEDIDFLGKFVINTN